MALGQSAAKLEREKKVQTVIAFASSLTSRLDKPQKPALVTDLQNHIRHLPLQASPAVTAKRDELDKLGTELWNLSTRLRRDEPAHDGNPKDGNARNSSIVCLLRAYAFLLLDSAGSQMVKGRERKSCIRLMKVALKAAKACILGKDLESATRVLERAATYEDILIGKGQHGDSDDAEIAKRLRLEYFAIRTVLAFRQDRLDMAEHMFAKCKQIDSNPTPDTAEDIADLLYEIGKQASTDRNYEAAVKWLERACNMLGEQDLGILSSEAVELRLCIMQSLVQAHMKLETANATDKAWHLVKLMEADYGDKMAVSLLKIELLSAAEHVDEDEYYQVLARMIRTIVLNDTNFKTLVHHIQKLKDLSNVYACKALDDLIKTRLLREENGPWIEKAIITRIWLSTSDVHAENALEQLQQVFDIVLQESNFSLSAPATHAAQTLLWKKVEEMAAQEQHDTVEAWCRLCLHSLLEKAGAQNKVKIIQSALSRQDYTAARDVYCEVPETGRDEPITRYLMYKVGIRSGDAAFAAECLDVVCRNSAKDATLLYACVMEAQSIGDKRQAINALERVLDKYDYTAPAGIHLPALLRVTLRLLQSEFIKDGTVDHEILDQLCAVFEGAYNQAKASRRRPSTPEQQLFTAQELEWFSKNSYNFSLKHCAEIPPQNLVRLLNICAELQYYLEVRKHCQDFRRAVLGGANKLSGAAQDDILSKQLQVVKLELEAALKLQRWDDLEGLFEQCWSCKSSDRYETLADLVLVIHSCLVQANVDHSYQSKVLSMLQKIINLTSRQNGNDVVRLSRWLRCLFNLTLPYDENISLKCLDQVTQIAAKKHRHTHRSGTPLSFMATPPLSSPVKLEDDADSADEEPKQPDCYPATELEWMATSSFNRAIDYYVGDNDAKCKLWAEKAMTVAQWLEDDGKLRDLLMGKFSALQFNK
ncbi:SPO22-domain-containing protein [Macroventuria anomochaeta]|uniref:SPO22-domain-containing protein n=1 Tax=Macroventuria anomochaeta TaxID=301207 RepID=A0ACB6S659_9PLEO|nr:SPO22-domain-containing protein [Macroventuria anomochaeta]KAF2629751.1 SPO22-domain-containing protein [Macroventuria anomochaeta]